MYKVLIKSGVCIAVCVLCCCSKTQPSAGSLNETNRRIDNDFLIIRSNAAQSYLSGLTQRLFRSRGAYLTVKIARDQEPFASSFEGNTIILSSGLIEQCSNEAELAFVVAHEYAHLELKHQLNSKSDLSARDLKERELDADIRALEFIFAAGFSLEGAKSSIAKFSDQFSGDSPVIRADPYTNYPSVAERLANLQAAILTELCSQSSGCLITGTTDSRAFRIFKRSL